MAFTQMTDEEAIERLKSMVNELADELEAEVEGHYHGIKDHPAMARRYDRDMEVVIRARSLIQQIDFR